MKKDQKKKQLDHHNKRAKMNKHEKEKKYRSRRRRILRTKRVKTQFDGNKTNEIQKGAHKQKKIDSNKKI